MRWCEREGIRWLESSLGPARVAFTTRLGGGSGDPYGGLNLATHTGDDATTVAANRRVLAAALAIEPAKIEVTRQVHGAEVVEHDTPPAAAFDDPLAQREEADGHAVIRAGLGAAVLVADCFPVAVAGPAGAAILHCGWRGLAAGIVDRGVRAVGATQGAIGPGIGPCCYEVGEEVLGRFAQLGPSVATERMLDLAAVAGILLERAGVESIETADLCTSCRPDLFYSHRRDGERTGRQAGVTWLT